MKENIEDTIKQLQIILKTRKKQEEIIECAGGFCRNCKPDIEALESSINILSDYKRIEQKELRLEKEVEIAKEALKKQCDIVDERNQLLRENQKLQKENEELKYKYDKALSDVITRVDLDNTYISKQKIKDKIEELKEKPLKIKVNNKYYYETDAYNKIIIQVLQDLLEEKGE